MKGLIVFLALLVCLPVYAQKPKAKPIEMPSPSHIALFKALGNDGWVPTYSHTIAGALFIHAEKSWGGNSKWQVSLLSADNKLSIWFYFLNNGKLETVPDNELNEAANQVAKSLLEELKKSK